MDLNRENVKNLKGIAILLMIYLHLFWNNDVVYISKMTKFANLCVPIFVFLSGYGLSKNGKHTLRDSLNRIFKFYKLYWSIFCISVTLLFLFTDFHFRLDEFILNLLGISYSYNHIWWYIPMYYLLLLLFPMLYKTIKYSSIILVVFFVFKILGKLLLGKYANLSPVNFPEIMFAICNSLSIYLIVFYIGILSGNDKWSHNRLWSSYMTTVCWIKKSKVAMIIALISIILISIYCPFVGVLHFIITPYICFILASLCSYNKFKNIGEYSTIIWLLHGILLKCFPKNYFSLNPIILYVSFVTICILAAQFYNHIKYNLKYE